MDVEVVYTDDRDQLIAVSIIAVAKASRPSSNFVRHRTETYGETGDADRNLWLIESSLSADLPRDVIFTLVYVDI